MEDFKGLSIQRLTNTEVGFGFSNGPFWLLVSESPAYIAVFRKRATQFAVVLAKLIQIAIHPKQEPFVRH